MERLIRAVQKIELLPTSKVGIGVRQGPERIQSWRIRDHARRGYGKPPGPVEECIRWMQDDLKEVIDWIAPDEFSEDYLFFLEYFGGLQIVTSSYTFHIWGVGLQHMDWYLHLMGDGDLMRGFHAYGLVWIGQWSRRWGCPEHDFFHELLLDLVGRVQKGCILAPPKEYAVPDSENASDEYNGPVLSDLSGWTVLASSFTELLELGYSPVIDSSLIDL